MARPRQFHIDDVVDDAIQVFWRKGYEATSIQDLVDATGLNRGSLYNTFGDKAGLFEMVLRRYGAHSIPQRLIAEAETGSPRALIERLFDDLVEAAGMDEERRGCLFTNTAAELAGREQALAEPVRAAMVRLEDTLTGLIARGQQTGEIAPWREPRTMARFLVACTQGLRVMSKVSGDQQALRDIADTALAVLD